MSTKNLPEKDISLIPIGRYCYHLDTTYDGPKLDAFTIPTVRCPYSTYVTIKGIIIPYCSYLEKMGFDNNFTDEEFEILEKHYGSSDALFDAMPLDLLWDDCKECGVRHEEDILGDDWYEDDENKIKELEQLNNEWIIKIKKLRDEQKENS